MDIKSKKLYKITLDNRTVGTTELEKADAPMGVVSGKIKFTDMASGYDFFKNYCLTNNIEIIADYPDDKLITTVNISGIRVISPGGTEIKGQGIYIEGMDSDFFEVTIFGIPYPFYEEEFPHHVESYGDRFKGTNSFEIKIIQKSERGVNFDFFIDKIQLSELLGFERLENMEFCNFDLDSNRKKVIERSIKGFLGTEPPFNQFETERIVLYRCHCGCDYCGVISCKIRIEEEFVFWEDLRYENDDKEEHEYVKMIDILKFKRKEYFDAFTNYECNMKQLLNMEET